MLVQGHKKGKSNPRTPVIAQDSVSSVQTVKILYGLAEGEIAGLANGAESIRLEKTPIRTNGVDNFKNVSFDVRNGTNDQSHIAGFDSVVNEIGVSVELRHDRPFTRAFTNLQLSAVAVRLKWDRLAQTNKDNGDVSGYRIDYAIDVMTDGGAWIEVLSAKVEDKASAGYVRTHRIDLSKAKKGWQIRVRRITANSTSEYISDKMYVDAVQEIIDSKLRYPNTALLALQYDAKAFQNIAKLAVRLKGKIIRVPSNYNAQNRTYSGLWDGTFIEAYSNNPAWVFYDLCLSKRYGIGSRLDASMVDKWSLYEMGRYCDELVDDGKGGKEPRFTVNLYLQKTEDAYHVLSQLAGVFRALSYWNGQSIVVNADVPKDPVFTYSRANVVDGLFKYTGSRARDRHTVVKVAWDDPNNDFETDYEWVKDEEAIARLGIRQLDISAFGCTSQAQAYRVGQWALLSEQLETQQVSFKTGLDGFIPQVGDIINVSDEIFAGRANGGRVSAINTAKDAVTLDRDVVAKVGDTLLINGADATETSAIVAVNGRVITVDKPFDSVEPQHVWAINSPDLQLMQFRVMSITKDDETFTITGVQYEPKKFTGIESSVKVTPRKITVNDAYRIDAPSFVNLSQSIATHQGQAVTTLTISWGQVAMASHYQVEWRKDGGSWIVMPKQSGVSADIVGVYAGNYEARVTAISPFDVASLATNSALTTITGKQGKPPALASIKAVGKLFGMDVSWVFANGSSDANYTEIQVASNANGANAVLLGMYSYPTNNTTINGLQGNLTQYYRGRIVDKLGNVSDWSNWVSGTTDASADKVLTLLSGQISQTQLAQDLAAPIGKIPAIETSVAKIPSIEASVAKIPALEIGVGKIPTLEAGVAKIPALEIGVGKIPSIEISVNAISQNLSVTNANLASETAKLNAAVADIEKSKQAIANAVVDVDALKKDGADFKQEISGIKSQQNALSSEIQTINTSFANADSALSQRIDTIKSASDKATADITTINQTKIDANQAQAIATSTTNARFAALSVGGRNLWLNSRVKFDGNDGSSTVNITANYIEVTPVYNGGYIYAWLPEGGAGEYTVSLDAEAPSVKLSLSVAYLETLASKSWVFGGKKRCSVTLSRKDGERGLLVVRVYNAPSVKLSNFKVEKGNVATDWTPAPEDVDAKIATTDATINEFKQTQATKDSATAERINSIDAAYKAADGQTNAKVATLEKAVSDGDGALSQRISSLDASYKSDNATTNARIAAEETARANADNATAQRIDTIKSASDKAAADITTINQTKINANQAQAIATSTTNARFAALSVGGRNLWLNSRVKFDGNDGSSTVNITANYIEVTPVYNGGYIYAWLPEGGAGEYTVSLDAEAPSVELSLSVAYLETLASKSWVFGGKKRCSVTLSRKDGERGLLVVRVYNAPSVKLSNFKVEKGNVATDWTPAPEDVDAKIATTDATINEFKQTQATKDSATAERINSIDAAYKAADGQTNAKVATLEKAVSDGDGALSQRISSLDASYKSDNATTNARIAAEETARANADNATAQRIDTIKSASDKAAADITTINQTKINANQAQAIATSTTNARFAALSVGGRNLWLNSRVKFDGNDGSSTVNITANYIEVTPVYNGGYIYAWLPEGGAGEYTVSLDAEAPSVKLSLSVAYLETLASKSWVFGGKKRCSVTLSRKDGERGLLVVRVYNAPSVKLSNFKVEKGNVATDWTPAPEDVDAKIATTDATINEFKQTQATKDSATAERINSIDAAYKAADGQTNAKVATLEKAVSDGDGALSQRISGLDADYKKGNKTITARIAAEETARANADSATAQRVGALETGASNSNARIANLETTTSNNTQAIATTQQQLTAKFSVQDTRNDNQPPSWYYANYPRQTVKEFKVGSVIGIGVLYAYLETTVRWSNASGGAIVQTAYDDSGNIFVRQGFGSTWAAWTKQENVTGSQAKVDEAKRILEGRISATDATITEFKQTQATKDSATAERINSIDAAYKAADGQTNAKVATLEKAVSDGDGALSQRISSLDASYKSDNATTNARIAAEETARANADNATAQRIDTIKSASDKAAADITTINQTKINANQAQAIATSTTNARFAALSVGGRNLWLNSRVKFDGNDGSSTVNITANYIEVTPVYNGGYIYAWLPEGGAGEYTVSLDAEAPSVELSLSVAYLETLASKSWVFGGKKRCSVTLSRKDGERGLLVVRVYNAPSVKLSNFKVEKGNVATDWTPAPEDVDAKIATTDATINEFKQTQATKDSATATQMGTLQTTVAGNTASIQTQQKSIDGLYVQWSIKVDVNGHVAGVGLANTGVLSSFIVNADSFFVSSPGGGNGVSPFTILNSPQVINGVTVAAGTYIKSAFIHDGSIDSAKIANAAITNAKIGAGEITSAKIGLGEIKTANIDNAAITTAKIGTAQVDTLQIAGEAVVVPRAQYNPNDVLITANNNQVKLLSASLETLGNVVNISLGFEKIYGGIILSANDAQVLLYIKIYRNGSEIKSYKLAFTALLGTAGGSVEYNTYYAINEQLLAIPNFLDTPPSGINAYEVYASWGRSGYSYSNSIKVTGASIQLLGVKR